MADLTINFIPPVPACVNGFKIKYRKVGTTAYTTISPNPTASPVVISGVDGTATYEGTIQSDCSNSIYSNVLNFTAGPCTGIDKKYINGVCTTATKQYISSVANTEGEGYTCTYMYVFPDGSRTSTLTEQSSVSCT